MNFPPSSQFPIPHSSQVQFSSGIPSMTQPSVGWHQQSKLSLPPLDAFSARAEHSRRVSGDNNGYTPSSGSGKAARKAVEKGKGVQTPGRPLSRNNTLLRDIHSPPTARSRPRHSDPSTSTTVNSNVNTTSVNDNNGLSFSSKQTSRSRRLSTTESTSHPGFGFDLSELIPPAFGRPVRGDNSRGHGRNRTAVSGCSTDGGGGGGGEYQFNMTFPSLIKSVAQKLNTAELPSTSNAAHSAFPPRSTLTSRPTSRSHSGSGSRRPQPRRQGDALFDCSRSQPNEVELGGMAVDVASGASASGSSSHTSASGSTRQLQRVPSLLDDGGGEGEGEGDTEEAEDSDDENNQFPPRRLPLALSRAQRSISNSTTSSTSCPTSSSPVSSTSPNTSASRTSRFMRSASSPNTSFSGSTSMDIDDECENEDVDMSMSATNANMSHFFESPYASSAPPTHELNRVNRNDITRSHSDQGRGREWKGKVKMEMLPPPSPPHPAMSTTTTIAGKSSISSSQLSQPFRPPFVSTPHPHPPPYLHLHQRQHQLSTSSTSSSSTSHRPRHPTSSSSLSSSTPHLPSLSTPPPLPSSTTASTTLIQPSRPPPPRLGMRGPPSLSQTSRSHSLPEKQRGFKVPLLPKKVLQEGSGGGTPPPRISSKVKNDMEKEQERERAGRTEAITSRDVAKVMAVKENQKPLKKVEDEGGGEVEDEGDTLGDSSFGDISLEWNDECENVMRAAGV